MRFSVVFPLFGLLVSVSACSLWPDPRPADRLVVASWNVQNLFDEVDDGGEYPEFDPERGWNRALFWARCDALAGVIRSLGPADVLVLEEVEGLHVLDVLRTRFLVGLGYQWWFLPPEGPGVKTAVLSRYPLVRTALLQPGFEPGLRPLVEVEIHLGDRSLIVVGNHWKSRIPSPGATEALRRASAEVLARRIATLEARADHPLVVAAGDFNTALELSRPLPDRALVPSGEGGGGEAGLVVYPSRSAAAKSPWPGAVWDPWDTVAAPRGSYVYQGHWDRLDHVFVAASALRLPD